MAVFANSIFVFLMLSGLLDDTKAISSNPVLEVPGLVVGSKIVFGYYGNDLSRVTLSIKDTIGKILHFELRHNEGCKGNSPEILLNTYTDGKFDTNRVITELPWLDQDNLWIITAEEDGFLIRGTGNNKEEYTHKFPYISPHKLSDIRKIQLYAKQGCGIEDSNFQGYLKINQVIPKGFKKVIFEGVKPLTIPFTARIRSGEHEAIFGTANYPEDLYSFVTGNYRKFKENTLATDYSQDNPIEGIIEKTGDSTYKATVWTSPDISYSYQITDMPSAEATGYLKLGFEKITKLEIDY